MKNRGYGWSVALLICSAIYLCLITVLVVYSVTQNQVFISSALHQLISRSTPVAFFELALGIVGINSLKWDDRNTQALFVLGLVACLFFSLGQSAVQSGAAALGIYDRAYGGLCAANFICLIGYSFSFRISKKESAGGRGDAAVNS